MQPEFVQEHWPQGTVEEMIHRLRRIVLVHSILYYGMDASTVSDTRFDGWARNLAMLQRDYPESSEKVVYHREAFRDYNGETGYHLPLGDERARKMALTLLEGRHG